MQVQITPSGSNHRDPGFRLFRSRCQGEASPFCGLQFNRLINPTFQQNILIICRKRIRAMPRLVQPQGSRISRKNSIKRVIRINTLMLEFLINDQFRTLLVPLITLNIQQSLQNLMTSRLHLIAIFLFTTLISSIRKRQALQHCTRINFNHSSALSNLFLEGQDIKSRRIQTRKHSNSMISHLNH